MALLDYFCKDGEKEEIGADLKSLGWTLDNPNPKGKQINFLFNNIFKYLNEFASKFSNYSLKGHTHNYLGVNAKAKDSDKLDGKDSTSFALSTHTHNVFETVWSGDSSEVTNSWGKGIFLVGFFDAEFLNIVVNTTGAVYGTSRIDEVSSAGDLQIFQSIHQGNKFKIKKIGNQDGYQNITSILKIK